MYRMCAAYGVPPAPVPATAKLAGDAAGQLNADASKAPTGAFHYWTIGDYGHVGLDTMGGGSHVFMASKYLQETLGDAIGFNSVVGYSRGIYPYRGWSMSYGQGGRITLVHLSRAMQYWVDEGVLDPNGPNMDPDKLVTVDTLCWFALKAIGKM
jgi:hypothetical protein